MLIWMLKAGSHCYGKKQCWLRNLYKRNLENSENFYIKLAGKNGNFKEYINRPESKAAVWEDKEVVPLQNIWKGRHGHR